VEEEIIFDIKCVEKYKYLGVEIQRNGKINFELNKIEKRMNYLI